MSEQVINQIMRDKSKEFIEKVNKFDEESYTGRVLGFRGDDLCIMIDVGSNGPAEMLLCASMMKRIGGYDTIGVIIDSYISMSKTGIAPDGYENLHHYVQVNGEDDLVKSAYTWTVIHANGNQSSETRPFRAQPDGSVVWGDPLSFQSQNLKGNIPIALEWTMNTTPLVGMFFSKEFRKIVEVFGETHVGEPLTSFEQLNILDFVTGCSIPHILPADCEVEVFGRGFASEQDRKSWEERSLRALQIVDQGGSL